MLSLASSLALGFVMGLRHALEPDHLAAVSTLVTRHRRPLAGTFVGMFWGMGHTLSLLAAGMVLALSHAAMPEYLARAFELAVAAMLVVLGLRSVIRAVHQGSEAHTHALHAPDRGHTHTGPGGHVHLGHWTVARQPLMVGLMHGLAGSGALSALAIASMTSPSAQIAYMALFGIGSIVGMASLTGLAGIPLAKLPKGRRPSQIVGMLSGAISLVVGVWWGWPLAFGA